jgi:hypothetical protein
MYLNHNLLPQKRPKGKDIKRNNGCGFFSSRQKKCVNHKIILDPNGTTAADIEFFFFFLLPSMYHEYRYEISPFQFPKSAAKLVILVIPTVYFRFGS